MSCTVIESDITISAAIREHVFLTLPKVLQIDVNLALGFVG